MRHILSKIKQRYFNDLKESITVRLPQNSLMDYLTQADKGELHAANSDLFNEHVGYFRDNKFWETDKGYRLPDEFLPKLVADKKGLSLLDIGTHVGSLPYYLKNKGLWKDILFTGTDVIPLALELAEKNHPEGTYFQADAQKKISDKQFDIVYTKGTIISTSAPDKTLDNVLDIPANYYFVLHQPLYSVDSGTNFEHILIIKKEEMYTSTIMNYNYFIETLKRHNLIIVKEIKRPDCKVILNFGDYYVYDFLLKKNA